MRIDLFGGDHALKLQITVAFVQISSGQIDLCLSQSLVSVPKFAVYCSYSNAKKKKGEERKVLISLDRICLGLESYQDVHKVDSWLRCLLLSVGKWYHPNSRSTVATVSRKKKGRKENTRVVSVLDCCFTWCCKTRNTQELVRAADY